MNGFDTILERISLALFFGSLIPIIFFLLDALLYKVSFFRKQIVKGTFWLFKAIILLLVIYQLFESFDGNRDQILETITYISTPLGFSIALLSIILSHSENKDRIIKFNNYLITTILMLLISTTVFMFVSSGKKEEIKTLKENSSQLLLSVYDFIDFYTGTITTNNIGEIFATLDIKKVTADNNNVKFEYSVNTNTYDDIYNYSGIGEVFLDQMKIDFTGFTVCDIKFDKNKLIFISYYPDGTLNWNFYKELK